MTDEQFEQIAVREIEQQRRWARIGALLIIASVLVTIALAFAIRVVGMTL